MTFHVVHHVERRAESSLAYVIRLLGLEPKSIALPDSPTLHGELDRIQKGFRHTPEPLLAAWRAARHLADVTEPGDVVVMSDLGGLGGIFALEQAAAEPGQRRSLWTVAADSAFLELRFVAGTHLGPPMPLDSQIDWEIVQYNWSDRVMATSTLAIAELAQIGAESELIGVPAPLGTNGGRRDPRHVWIPGPVSRRNQVGEILRALTSLPGSQISLSDDDTEDQIWTGSAWEALRHSREVLGARVERGPQPTDPSTIVIGDPFAIPDSVLESYRADGVPVVVPADSAASLIWPDAPTWVGADDLVRLFEESGYIDTEKIPTMTTAHRPSGRTGQSPLRARAVSVGIPVFREVRFLTETVQSVLDQEHAAVELLLIDDGSHSGIVDQVFGNLVGLDSRVRTLRTEHRGVCAARNVLLETMKGDSFLLIDSDDILLPTFLSRCASALNSRDDVWAVATWTEFFGVYEAIEAKPPFDARVGRRENPIISTPVLADRKVLDEGIRFAPDLAFLYCEDWHFWSQIVAAGGRFGLVPEPLVRHRVHQASGGFMRTELAYALGRSRATEPLPD
ncbi:MAG: glycosyltransferase family A protein [Acidimicrobiia bacterium]